jgi:hypothetical protein
MWTTEWRAISARIQALLDIGKFLLNTKTSEQATPAELVLEKTTGYTAPARYIAGAVSVIGKNVKDTGDLLLRFFESHDSAIPERPRACLRKFVEENRWAFGVPDHLAGVSALLVAFASFRAEFEYLIADTEAIAKSLVARAFAHLQSSITIDESVRNKWVVAFERSETTCELLGACHLLQHGIWAFKASVEGARTDLVLGETTWDEPKRAAHGLVLTEWKRVQSENELSKKADEACKQAKLYCEAPLAGFEVTSTRYLVLVSKPRLEMPPPRIFADVVYEFRNVAVAPDVPSREARKRPQSRNRREHSRK